MRFRILRGLHSDGDNLYGPRHAETGEPTPGTVGDVIETEIDLVARFGREKFERIHEPEPRQERRRREPVSEEAEAK